MTANTVAATAGLTADDPPVRGGWSERWDGKLGEEEDVSGSSGLLSSEDPSSEEESEGSGEC